MQLARGLPMITILPLEKWILHWKGLWFSIFPNLEMLLARLMTDVAVVGLFLMVRRQTDPDPSRFEPAGQPPAGVV